MYKYFPTLIIGMTSGILSSSAYKHKHNKISRFFSLISLICVIILLYAGHHVDVYFDARNYNEMISFNKLAHFSLFNEWIYNFLSIVGNFCGLNFFQFKLTLILLCLLLNYYVYKEFASNYGLALFLYLCGTIYMDAMQLQNFIATCVFTWALGCYIKSKKRFLELIYCVFGVFIAAEIHTAYWIALIYLIITIKHKKTVTKIAAFFAILIVFITIINENSIPIVKTIMLSSTDHRLQRYALNPTRLGWLPSAILLLIYILIMHLIKRELSVDYRDKIVCKKNIDYTAQLKWVSTLYLIDLITLLIIPFNIMITHMYRMIRNLSLIHFLCIASTIEYFPSKTAKKYIVIIGTFFIVIGWFIFEYFLNNTIGDVIIPTLTGEYL